MGKRSKTASENSVLSDSKVNEEIDSTVILDTSTNNEHPQKSKKRKNKTEVTENKNKIAKNAVLTEEAQEENTKKKDKSKNKSIRIQNNPDKNKSNKKIIFEEDTGEPIEVAATSSKEVDKKQNIDLEQVKDEDIDKFCDELTEEDNVQYESWIQQIEAKLKSNKKSSKT